MIGGAPTPPLVARLLPGEDAGDQCAYGAFVRATGREAPDGWTKRVPPRGEEDYPVVKGLLVRCQGLLPLAVRGVGERLWPTERSGMGKGGTRHGWPHLSVGRPVGGHTLKLSGKRPGETTSVLAYPQGASPYGGLDMAGNVWEWTGVCGGGVRRIHTTAIRTGRLTGVRTWMPGERYARMLRGAAFDYNLRRAVCLSQHGLPERSAQVHRLSGGGAPSFLAFDCSDPLASEPKLTKLPKSTALPPYFVPDGTQADKAR